LDHDNSSPDVTAINEASLDGGNEDEALGLLKESAMNAIIRLLTIPRQSHQQTRKALAKKKKKPVAAPPLPDLTTAENCELADAHYSTS
jgi:hypothetical protein